MERINLGIWPITDEKIITCPNCKSVFIIEGTTSPGAPKFQTITCPVCGQAIVVDTVRIFGLGRIWYPKKVLVRVKKPPLPEGTVILKEEQYRELPGKKLPQREVKKEKGTLDKILELPDEVKFLLTVGGVVIGGLILIKLLE
ncbi:MAG: hypothetical protein B6D55_02360 [Candidatus Omnitrophica bacterium 4484_70.2]|nr:MAG: hypothetical protein B6D55_02360 [Candidatus Omnitrophica bacterium 4484_70.2]